MKKLLLIIILLIAAATPIFATSTQGTCGDNICRADTGEDKQTCPTDCGYLPPSNVVFELVDAHWGINGVEIQFNFYYDNQSRTVLRQDQIYANGTIWPPLPGFYCHNANGNPELDKQLQKEGHCDDVTPARSPHQMINDALCTFEVNSNKFDFITSPSYGKVYKLTIPVVNDGIYEGLIRCTSNLGNVTWPAAFGIRGQHLDTYTAGPEVINNLPPEKVPSIYRDYINKTKYSTNQTNTTTQQQSITKQIQADTFTLFGKTIYTTATTLSNYAHEHPIRAIFITIALALITLISILLSIRKTAEYTWHKITAKPNTKLPKTAITITLLTILTAAIKILAIITIPLILLLTTIKFTHKTITHILNKRQQNKPHYKQKPEKKNQVKIEQIE